MPQNLVFSDIIYGDMPIGRPAGVHRFTPSESVKVRHSALASENFTNISHNLETVQDRR